MTDLCVTVNPVMSFDRNILGAKQISGTVYEGSDLGSYLVRLHNKRSGQVIRSQFSENDGSYAFTNLSGESSDFYAVAFDHGSSKSTPAISDTLVVTDMVIPDF